MITMHRTYSCHSVLAITLLKLLLQIMARKQYILVRWLEDETVGIMPISAVHKDSQGLTHVGAVVDIKFGQRYYTGEIYRYLVSLPQVLTKSLGLCMLVSL